MKPKVVIIIGGGYGGLRACEHLAKTKQFEIILFDKNPYHYMQAETYGYIAGRFDLADIALDIDSFLSGLDSEITFIQENINTIDTKRQQVSSLTQQLHYDYLIIATGAQTNFFPSIEGAKQYTHGVKSIKRAFEFRQTFEKQLYTKLQHKANTPKEHFDILIAGAGLSGVEIAAEMAYTLKHYQKIFAPRSIEIRITLIDAAKTILPGVDSYLITQTQKRLTSLGVQTLTDTSIVKFEKNSATLSSGKKIDFDFAIFTAGIKGSNLAAKLKTPKTPLDQIIPNKMLQLEGIKNVFAIGDCAYITNSSGEHLPPTAQIAEKTAAYVASAINLLHLGQTPPPFDAKIDGIFIALGGRYASGILFDRIKVSGFVAYTIKKAISLLYRLGLEIKVNIAYRQKS